MKYFYLTILVISLNVIQASIYSSLKNNVLSLLQKTRENSAPERRGSLRYFQQKQKEDARDAKSAQNKASILKNVRTHEEDLNIGRDMPSSKLTESLDKKIGREYFHMDPVLNELKRRSQRRSHQKSYRRKAIVSTDSESSNLEMKFWLDDWDEQWMQKKFDALNSTQPRGDVANMAAARPWGVPCGDPNQHDMPWGTCMLAAECDAEFRIYRGDYFCGRTHYVCCAVLLSNYDMYQGLDLSFQDSSFSTDSNEKTAIGNSEEEERKRRKHERSKRRRERKKRKRDIAKSIRRIVQEIRKILTRAWSNGTAQRKKKTKDLKKFIETLKKQYKKDRKAVVSVHEHEVVKIDTDLLKRLDEIQNVNQNFMSNDTFRDIIVNGTLNTERMKMLLRAHPEIAKLIGKRRSNDDDAFPTPIDEDDPKNVTVLEYDLEYGKLYY